MSAQYAFGRRFEAISKEVEFQDSWNNGTGYLDGAVHQGPKLNIGEQVKCTTQNGRRVIITGTQVGNVVMFERYSPVDKIDQDAERSSVIVHNSPDALRAIIGDSSLSEDRVLLTLGTPGNSNIGKIVERLIEQAAKLSKFYGE